MGKIIGNCVEIKGDGILSGIPCKASQDFVGDLPLDVDNGITRIHHAWLRFNTQRTRQKIVSCAPAKVWNGGVIVYIEVFDLHFGDSPFLQGLDVWPGAEGERMWPFWKSSFEKLDHRNLNHAQIWLLLEDVPLSICDRVGGLRVLKFSSGEVTLTEPTPATVISFFRKHIQDNNEKRRAWALRNIKLLLDAFPDAEGIK